MKLVKTISDIPFSVSLCQQSPDTFAVIYGMQMRDGLSYTAAAKEMGLCIMHSLTCDGKITFPDDYTGE